MYKLNKKVIEDAIEIVLKNAVRISLLKRDSSWQSIPETPARIKDMEVVFQGNQSH
jgi:hypothetical protein